MHSHTLYYYVSTPNPYSEYRGSDTIIINTALNENELDLVLASFRTRSDSDVPDQIVAHINSMRPDAKAYWHEVEMGLYITLGR